MAASSLWVVLLVLLLCSHTVNANEQDEGVEEEIPRQSSTLLLVVGDVTSTTARILVQSLANNNTRLNVQVFKTLDRTRREYVRTLELLVRNDIPQVIQIEELAPLTPYTVVFDEDGRDRVTFRTFAAPGKASPPLKLVFVSCNRFNEDLDATHWERLAVSERNRDGLIHLGDQIYADALGDWLKKNSSISEKSLLHLFREMYVKTWSEPLFQRILRHGPNWMIIDDHDIINNFDNNVSSSMNAVLQAGRQAFYEYQFALQADISLARQQNQAFYSRRVGPLGIYFLDTRLQRTFQHDASHPFLGSVQLHDIKKTLQKWGNDPSISRILVLSSVPLISGGPLAAALVYQIEQEKLPTHSENIDDTILLLDELAPYHEKVTIVGGDIHMYMESSLCRSDGVCLSQISTSGMTEGSTVILSPKIYVFVILWFYLFPRTAGHWEASHTNAFLGKNYAVLQQSEETREWIWTPRVDPDLSGVPAFFQLVFDILPLNTLIIAALLSVILSFRLLRA